MSPTHLLPTIITHPSQSPSQPSHHPSTIAVSICSPVCPSGARVGHADGTLSVVAVLPSPRPLDDHVALRRIPLPHAGGQRGYLHVSSQSIDLD